MPRLPKQPEGLFPRDERPCPRADQRPHSLAGPYDSPESRARYDALIDEWKRRGHVERMTITLGNLALDYLDHAEVYYRKGGWPTSELPIIRARPLRGPTVRQYAGV